MRILFVMLLLCFAGCSKKAGNGGSSKVIIPGLAYIDNLASFVSEDSKDLSDAQIDALNVAKDQISEYLDCEVRGKFLIAEAAWGFQINFSEIDTNEDGEWIKGKGDFGDVFVSKDLKKVKMEYREGFDPDDELE